MHAVPAATEEYHERHPGLHTSILGRTGLRVSGAGFGSYRVSIGINGHRLALRKALSSGINLIDTSSNYADGGSEELIGETLAELVREGSVQRSEVVIVTKVGYIQGTNYEIATERVESGSGFPEVVEYAEGLWHCISPEFIEDQLTRSLGRLQLPSVDVLLLHNPEYYLGWAHKQGMPIDEARTEYYRRIRNAFRYLEEEVERGRIGYYGISSNSFPDPTGEPDFTSLEEVVKIAESIQLNHHFQVIQFPANLLERGFVVEKNQSGDRTLMDVAREKGIGVLVNRPLNAIIENKLTRLADFPIADTPVSEDDILAKIQELIVEETGFFERSRNTFSNDPEGARAIEEFLTVGMTMHHYWQQFGTVERFNEMLSQHISPRLGYVAQYLRENGTQEHLDWYNGYMNHVRALLHAIGAYYSGAAQQRSNELKKRIGSALDSEDLNEALSCSAIRLLLGVDGVDCVLVGMRREEYVEDVLGALRAGPLGNEEVWRKMESGV